MPSPLEGVRVIEVSQGIAGPYAAMLLSEMGADVIKVEPPQGDRYRSDPAFGVVNRSKQGVVLDFAGGGADRARLRELIGSADVLIHDFPPAQAEALGVAAHQLAPDYPELVVCDITGYGHSGPYADLPADEGIAAALSSLHGSQTSTRPGPTFLVLPLCSYAAAMLSAASVAAALFERLKIGAGQSVSTSLLASGFAMRFSLFKADNPGVMGVTRRDPQGSSATYRLYEAGDGNWFMLGDPRGSTLDRLCIAIDRTDLLMDSGGGIAAAMAMTVERTEMLIGIFSAIFKTQPIDYWLRVLRDEHDLAIAPVLSHTDFVSRDLVMDNEMTATIDDPDLGRMIQMNFPIATEGAPGIKGPAPRLGEHNTRLSTKAAAINKPSTKRLAPSGAPLAGIRVIDASSFIAGPTATRLLADLGADVIKVESPVGEGMRGTASGNTTFVATNRGKRSLCYDHSTPEGRELFYDLIRTTDILIDGFRPAALTRMGIDYETLAKINPRLIHCSITGFGRATAWSTLPSFDPILGALSGAYAFQGGLGHPPVSTGSSSAPNDLSAGYLGDLAVIAALYERERTGVGRRISMPQVNAAMAIQATEMVFRDGTRLSPDRGGPELLGLSATYRLFQAADRWVFVAGTQPEHWPALCGVLGLDALAQRHTAEAVRTAASTSEIADAVADAIGRRSAQEVTAALNQAGVPCVPLFSTDDPGYDPDSIFESPEIAENEFVARHEHAVFGSFRQPGQFIRFDGRPATSSLTAPILGEHNDEIVRSLGYDADRIAALRAKGVLRGGA